MSALSPNTRRRLVLYGGAALVAVALWRLPALIAMLGKPIPIRRFDLEAAAAMNTPEVKLLVENKDATPEEFESASLRIEKVIPGIDYLPLFLNLLARSGTGQKLTSYTHLIGGPAPRITCTGMALPCSVSAKKISGPSR